MQKENYFSTKLLFVLKEKNLTQKELSKILGVQEAVISRWIKDKTGRVVKTLYNKDFTLDGISQYFIQKILKKAGLRGSLHTLRHTFASWLVQNGVDLYTVSKLLGHSSVTTTEIYAHLSPNSFRSALCKLPKL